MTLAGLFHSFSLFSLSLPLSNLVLTRLLLSKIVLQEILNIHMVVRQVACQVQLHTLVDQVGIANVKAG